MSTLKVEIVEILKSEKHPNADKLSVYTINGWQVIGGLDQYKVGQKVIYFPIDSILPAQVESKIFGPDSKVKLSKSRIKTIKLRGAVSQGLITDPTEFGLERESIGADVTAKLGVIKYEPPEVPTGYGNVRVTVSKKNSSPYFHKYTDLENAKNYPNLFEEGEEVVITEKIHGTNFRCGYVPFNADTFVKKIKKFFGLAPKFEFVYGSRNMQLQNQVFYTGYYDSNVYADIVKKYDLRDILKEGEVVYGEIYGDGIQKNYSYGLVNEKALTIFDVMVNEQYLDSDKLSEFTFIRDLPLVPVLYKGKFSLTEAKEFTKGDSVLASNQKIREGVVIKPAQESKTYIGRKILKLISDDYLMKDNSDFH